MDRDPRPSRPTLVLVSGVPLVGKTTLARRLVDRLGTETLHVENDRLRVVVAEAMGRGEPSFDGDENLATYAAARRLVERAIEAGLHAVHDATNLRASARRESYRLADELDAPVRVLFVDAPRDVLEHRARQEGPAAQRALDALGDRRPSPSEAERPHLVLDGTRDPDANVDRVLAADAFSHLVQTSEA